MQSRSHSALEAVSNVVVGYALALATQAAVFPLFGLYASHREHAAIALVFTGISLVRSYVLRRLFDGWVRA